LEPSYETDKAVSDLWLVSADGLNMEVRAVDQQYSVERSDDRFRTLPMRFTGGVESNLFAAISFRLEQVPIGSIH
jgi:hypothetical protein